MCSRFRDYFVPTFIGFKISVVHNNSVNFHESLSLLCVLLIEFVLTYELFPLGPPRGICVENILSRSYLSKDKKCHFPKIMEIIHIKQSLCMNLTPTWTI